MFKKYVEFIQKQIYADETRNVSSHVKDYHRKIKDYDENNSNSFAEGDLYENTSNLWFLAFATIFLGFRWLYNNAKEQQCSPHSSIM